MTVLSRLSKADTAFLCEPAGAGAAAMIVDASQYRTNLTNNTTYVSESPSARTALATPRTVSVVVNMTSTSSGYLVYHGSGGFGYKYAMLKSGTNIRIAENNGTLFNAAIPGLAAAARKVLVHWAQRVDGSSVISECSIYNFVTNEWSFGSLVHAATVPDPTHNLTIGAGSGGASTYSLGVTAFHVVRIGRRFISATEAREDFVSETTPPVMSGRRRTPLLTASSTALPISGPGEFAGPQFLLAAAATKEADARGKNALVNEVFAHPVIETNSYAPANWYSVAPDDDYFHMPIRYFWHAYGVRVNRARCRILVQAYNIGGALDPICPLHFRMYSFGKSLKNGAVFAYPYVDWRRTADHTPLTTITGSTGVWLDLGDLVLLSDNTKVNLMFFGLALSFNEDQGDPLEGQTRVVVKAVTIEPYFYDANDGEGDGDNAPKDKKK